MLNTSGAPGAALLARSSIVPHDRIGLREAGAFLRRSAWSVCASAGLCFALAALYVYFAPLGFQATAQLVIEPQKSPELVLQNSGFLDLTISNSQVESQIELIRSARISAAVIRDLSLLSDPEFQPRSGFFSSDKPRVIPPGPAQEDSVPFQLALIIFSQRVDVRRIGQSYVVQVSFRANTPEKSAKIANAIVQAYIADQLAVKVEAARRGREWLEQRTYEIRRRLFDSAHAVQQYRARADAGGATGNPLDAEVTLDALESSAATYRKMFENFQQKIVEASQQESYPSADARIIGLASIPLAATFPNKRLIVALAAVAGIFGGLSMSALRQTFDRSIRTPSQIFRDLGLVSLGSLPNLDSYSFSDDMRRVKAYLDAVSSGTMQVIGITSVRRSEGKTTLCRGLSELYSTAGSNCVLVDGNLQNPTLTETLTSGRGEGLYEIVTRGADPLPVRTTLAPNGPMVNLLGAGILPVSIGISVLPSANVHVMLERLRTQYQRVIVDLPSLTCAQTLEIAAQLDGVILICESGRVTVDEISLAARTIEAVDGRLIGVVVSKVRLA